ncbi:MAG: hypothetical protein KR126chlam3_00205 [Chlamydiae bacterium]|nr:hypothetical protein [Chlamydiota bacterium]
MTTNTQASHEKPMRTYSEYWAPPIAAAAAIIPTFHGLIVKTAQQLGKTVPKWNFNSLRKGAYAAPFIGGIIGSQMVGDAWIKKTAFMKEKEGFSGSFISAVIVGAASSPILAGFQAITRIKKQGFMATAKIFFKGVKGLTAKEAALITVREGSFVGSLATSDEMDKRMKGYFGDNKITQCSSYFMSGVAGSIIGYPFDTMFARLQAGVPNSFKPKSLMQGAPIKAINMGVFYTLYKLGTQFLQNN